MSIQSEINRISTNIANAYDELETKGATMPQTENSNNLATTIASIPSGGGTEKEYFARVIDYDGTILKEQEMDDGEVFTLPTSPTHAGLTFQSWSSSQEIINNTVTINKNNVIIGATYTTTSGLSEFDIELTNASALTYTLNLNGTKNWGDGTTDTNTTHTYATTGNYTITCNGTTMTTSSSSGLFGQGSSGDESCVNARITNIVSIKAYAFSKCKKLKTIILSNSVVNFYNYIFDNCVLLKAVVIPSSVTKIVQSNIFSNCNYLQSVVIPYQLTNFSSSSCFYACRSLDKIVIPKTMSSIPNSCFSGCYVLKKVILHCDAYPQAFFYCYGLNKVIMSDSVNSVLTNAFNYCTSLKKVILSNNLTTIIQHSFENCNALEKIKIPKNVTSIENAAFTGTYNLDEVDFSDFTSIPTVQSDSFMKSNSNLKIIVPDTLYSDWIVTSNWGTYSDFIVKASEA